MTTAVVPVGKFGLSATLVNHVDEDVDAVYFFERDGLEIASIFIGHIRSGMRTEMLKKDWLRYGKPFYVSLQLNYRGVQARGEVGPFVVRWVQGFSHIVEGGKVEKHGDKKVYLHQEILGTRDEQGEKIHDGYCRHLDGDTMNNVRSNLWHPCVEEMPVGMREEFGRRPA
jgi:hypothetical protein